jgi:hypothetical protein
MRRCLTLCAGLCALALAGCTDADWDQTMSAAGFREQRVADIPPPPAAQPVAMAAPPDSGFCEAVAKKDATADGFDAATQNRVYQQSFRQCAALFGPANPTPQTAALR